MMKRKLFWMLNVILNSARLMAVLIILEKAGWMLDWPNGTEAMPVLVPVALADEVRYAPYVEIDIEKAASQGTD